MKLSANTFVRHFSTEQFTKNGYSCETAGYFAQILEEGINVMDVVVSSDDSGEWMVAFYDVMSEKSPGFWYFIVKTEKEAHDKAQIYIDSLSKILSADAITAWPDGKKWTAIFAVLGVES